MIGDYAPNYVDGGNARATSWLINFVGASELVILLCFFYIFIKKLVFRLRFLSNVTTLLGVFEGGVTKRLCFFLLKSESRNRVSETCKKLCVF